MRIEEGKEKTMTELARPSMVEVWGIAAGRRTTKEAARGAFTFREYKGIEEWEKAKGDWLQIVSIKGDPRERRGEREKKETGKFDNSRDGGQELPKQGERG